MSSRLHGTTPFDHCQRLAEYEIDQFGAGKRHGAGVHLRARNWLRR